MERLDTHRLAMAGEVGGGLFAFPDLGKEQHLEFGRAQHEACDLGRADGVPMRQRQRIARGRGRRLGIISGGDERAEEPRLVLAARLRAHKP